jgi:hypothetical protein
MEGWNEYEELPGNPSGLGLKGEEGTVIVLTLDLIESSLL